MHWFDIPHALLVILIVSQISVGLSNDEIVETTTLDPATSDPASQADPTDDEQQITRRFIFKRPPVSAYQPTNHKKPKHVIQELPMPPPPPPPPPPIPQYTASWPVAPVEQPMQPQMSVAMPMSMPAPMPPSRPMVRPRIRRPRPNYSPAPAPAPSAGNFLPSAISGLTDLITGGGGQPGAGSPSALGPLGNLLGPLSGLVKPALSLLGPIAKNLLGATPMGKTLMDIFEMIKKILSFFTDFNLPKFLHNLLHFIPDTIKHIMSIICGMFSFIPRLLNRLCRLFGNIFKLIPKALMLIPRFFHWLHKLPECIQKCIELLYRFCKTIEMFLAYLKQALWNMLRLLGNTILLPLKIISKTITEVIHLPIKLLAEPIFAFTELMRAILYPFRKLYHFVMSRLDDIVEVIYNLVKMLFGSPSTVPTAVAIVSHSQIPLIRVFPKLPNEPSSSLVSYILGKR